MKFCNPLSRLAAVLFIFCAVLAQISCNKDDAAYSYITLSHNALEFGKDGESAKITIYANTGFTVSSEEDWLTHKALPATMSSGTGETEYLISVLPHDGTAERTASILFLSSDKSVQSKLIVKQSHVASRNHTIFSEFGFKEADNVDYLQEDIMMDIGKSTVSGRIPYYSSTRSLVAFFKTDAVKVEIDGVEQVSGQTANDFSKPVTYTLTSALGETYQYTVDLVNFTGLPVMFITTEGKAPIDSKDVYVNGKIVIDGMGAYPDFEKEAQLKGRGNSTWALPKKPYRIKFDKKQELLGMPAHKSWVLLANYTDKSGIRNEAAFDLSRMTELAWTPRTRFVEVFLNGVYNGTYQLTEMIKINENRVDVTDNGFLIEVDNKPSWDDITFRTDRLLFTVKDPDVVVDDEIYTFIKDYVNNVEDVLYSALFLDEQQGYKKWVDIESFADWYLVNEITKNNDALFYSSCYMNYAPGGKLKMGPVWDFDIAIGNINYNGCEDYQGFWVKNALWMARMFEDPVFVAKVKERYALLRSRKDEIIAKINSNANTLQWSALENNNRWHTLYAYTWPNDAIWGSYRNEVQYMKNWLNQRFSWLDTAIPAL